MASWYELDHVNGISIRVGSCSGISDLFELDRVYCISIRFFWFGSLKAACRSCSCWKFNVDSLLLEIWFDVCYRLSMFWMITPSVWRRSILIWPSHHKKCGRCCSKLLVENRSGVNCVVDVRKQVVQKRWWRCSLWRSLRKWRVPKIRILRRILLQKNVQVVTSWKVILNLVIVVFDSSQLDEIHGY